MRKEFVKQFLKKILLGEAFLSVEIFSHCQVIINWGHFYDWSLSFRLEKLFDEESYKLENFVHLRTFNIGSFHCWKNSVY